MPRYPFRSRDLPERGGGDRARAADQVAPIERKPVAGAFARKLLGEVSPAPIAVWLSVQLAALCLAAFRVPLAAHYAQAGELHGVLLLIATQFGALALLFPWLLPSAAMTLITLAACWLMLLSAAALAAWPFADVIPLGVFLSAWIAALRTIRLVAPIWMHSLVSAILSLYFIGGPLIAYFRLEYVGAALHETADLAYGPLLTVITTPRHLPPLAWVEPVLLFAIAGSIGFLLKNRHRSAPLSSTNSI